MGLAEVDRNTPTLFNLRTHRWFGWDGASDNLWSQTIRPLLDQPRFIEVHRLGAFPDRSLDIDVVFDLMIHDLDVVLSIVPSEIAAVEAVGVAVLTPEAKVILPVV